MSAEAKSEEPASVRKVRSLGKGIAAAAVCAALAWAAVALTGGSGGGTGTKAGAGTRAGAGDAKPAAPASCRYTPTGVKPAVGIPAYDKRAAARPYLATLVTDRGDIVFRANGPQAPCAAYSFAYLAARGYFAGGACHRLVTAGIHVLECGDPEGTGYSDPGYAYPDENTYGARYRAGTVAVSKAFPGQNGSQFFISYADPETAMDPLWTPFGQVVSGLDVLRAIAAAGTADGSTDGRPRRPVVIEDVRIQ